MKAVKEDRIMSDKEELFKAIECYDILTPKYKAVLKTLINLAIDDLVIITIKELSKLSNTSKPVVYKAISLLEDQKMLEVKKRDSSRLSEFVLKPLKLDEIVKYYNVRENFKKTLR